MATAFFESFTGANKRKRPARERPALRAWEKAASNADNRERLLGGGSGGGGGGVHNPASAARASETTAEGSFGEPT